MPCLVGTRGVSTPDTCSLSSGGRVCGLQGLSPPGRVPLEEARGGALGSKGERPGARARLLTLDAGTEQAGGVDGPREGSGGCCSKDGGQQSSHVEMKDVA